MNAVDRKTKRHRSRRRRAALRRLRRSRIRQHDGRVSVPGVWHYALGLDALWVVLLILAGAVVMLPSGVLFGPDLSEGDIATRDYQATRDMLIPDEEATEERREQARADVRPLYDFDSAQNGAVGAGLRRLFATARAPDDLVGRLPDEEAAEERLRRLREASGLRVSQDDVAWLEGRVAGADGAEELEEQLVALVDFLLRDGIVQNKETLLQHRVEGVILRDLQTGEERQQLDLYDVRSYPVDVQAALEAEVGRWAGWSRADRQLVVNFLMANLTPNIYLNLNETQLRRSAAAAAVDQVFTQIRAGQVIVRRGDEIDRDAMDLVRELSGEAGTLTRLRSPLASAILLGLSAGFLWVAFRRKRLVSVEARAFGGVVVLLILGLVAARFGLVVSDALAASFTIEALSSAQSYALAIPFAGVALLASLLYGRGAGLLAGLVFSVFVGRLGWGEAAGAAGALTGGAMFYSLTGSLAAVFALDQLKERSAVTRAGVLVGVVNMASVTLLALIEENGTTFSGLGIELFCGLLGGLMVAAVVAFAMPVFEAGLFRTTDIKLMELSDTNLPLLQRLAFEAPGTFQHSLMVAHFAKACCEAVGGNPTLAYVGGLYHDIGKMTRPRYFVENQHEGENPHDGLSPSMSALIIIDHVKEGARMAREHGLPQPIIDAIEQHHGTRALKFFLLKAREQAEPGEEISEHQYRYPGPMPQDKTMAALMISDSVEAASRTLGEYTEESIHRLVERLFDDIMEAGQFSQTDLTLADLRRMRYTLKNVLRTVHHHRLDYPGFDFKGTSRGSLRVLAGGASSDAGGE